MTKDEYCALLQEISGSGGDVGVEATIARREAERAVTDELLKRYWGLSFLGDAVHQFYLDTLREISRRSAGSVADQALSFFIHWHIVSSSRFYAAFDLFSRGYYFECASLARSLWETALTLTAIKQGVVSLEEAFGGRELAGKISHKELSKRVRGVDSRIQRALIWENTRLHDESREAVETFLFLLNSATHKATLALIANVRLAQRGEAVPILPQFDAQLTEVTGNLLFLATWCLMTTLRYLTPVLPEAGNVWHSRYQKLIVAFEQGTAKAPNPVVKGFEQVVSEVFSVT